MRLETHHTRHARERELARGIPEFVADLMQDFGASVEARDGALKYYLTGESMKDIRRYAGRLIADLMNKYRHLKAYIIVKDGRVITAAYE